jgi:hypothetical protein
MAYSKAKLESNGDKASPCLGNATTEIHFFKISYTFHDLCAESA